jgi:membrane associated rhomboid family serine protease
MARTSRDAGGGGEAAVSEEVRPKAKRRERSVDGERQRSKGSKHRRSSSADAQHVAIEMVALQRSQSARTPASPRGGAASPPDGPVGPAGEPLTTDARGRIRFDSAGVPIPMVLNKAGVWVPHALGSDGKLLLPLQPIPLFTMFMIVGCLVGFGMSLWITGGIAPTTVNPTIGPSPDALVACGAKVSILIYGPTQQWWRLVAPLWLHAGVVHLVSNMMTLWNYGPMLEANAGILKFSLLYVASGVFSIVVSALFSPGAVTVGASGAIFGLMGAFTAELAQNWHMIPTVWDRVKAGGSLLFSVCLNLALGLMPFIDNFAHLGGLVAGLLVGLPLFVYAHKSNEGGKWGGGQKCLAVSGAVLYVVLLAAGLYGVSLGRGFSALSLCPTCSYISCVPTPWWSCPDLSGYPAGYGPSPTPAAAPSPSPSPSP